YASWIESADEPSPSTTSKGFPPPPVQSWRRSMQMSIVEASSRRTFWFVIGGIAVGAGAGIAVISTSSSTASTRPAIHDKGSDKHPSTAPAIETQHGSGDRRSPPDAAVATPSDAGSAVAFASTDAGTSSPGDAGAPADAGTTPGSVTDSLDTMLDGEHVDLAKGDIHALAQRAVPGIYGFGVDADEVIDSRSSFEAVLNRDLGAPPPGGFDIELKYLQVGQERDFAWTAEDLAITSHGKTRRFGITQLVGKIDNKWTIIAWQWAFGVPDATASRLVHDGTMPALKPIADAHANAEPVDAAFRDAFASPAGYAEAISPRGDAFNFGSSSEHVVGGSSVKTVFAHLPAKLGIHDGVHAATISPYVGIAAANVDFTTGKTKQTFRVLSILLRERTTWHVIQTQWSNGGPIK
ncbi:MAG TPA: nuclear transport factor 2 family protein, partial [Kofleriaceae bacterium]|nr:nuclear transport factor 2 family protein [Kofleriaceae bacterium]